MATNETLQPPVTEQRWFFRKQHASRTLSVLLATNPALRAQNLVNKAMRQSSLISAAVAQYIASRQATNVVDTLTPAQIELMFSTALNASNISVLNGAGTADALVANFTPAATTRQAGIMVAKALATNATTTPTLARDAQAALTIVKGNNLPLAPGDIIAGMPMLFSIDTTLNKEVLLNPATGVTGNAAPKQMQSILASVAASALTLTLNPTSLDFRATPLTSGAVNTRTLAAAASLVVPSGATLGTVNGAASKLDLLALDNAGTIELAVTDIAGGVNLDETTLISTTVMDAASDSANVLYSTVARSNLPFRVVGFVDSTQAAAGTWATAPSTIQGAGGNALDAMQSIGFGQTYQTVTGSRAMGTSYYNTTSKPIWIHCITSNGGGSTAFFQFTVDGIAINTASTPAGGYALASFMVPPGKQYSVTNTGGFSLTQWVEQR